MSDMDNILDLFDCDNNDDESNISKNENYYISEILKLIKDSDNFPLYIYCMIKTLLQKKDILNDSQIKEIAEILNIKPKIVEKVIVKEKIIYKERKPRVYEDDY